MPKEAATAAFMVLDPGAHVIGELHIVLQMGPLFQLVCKLLRVLLVV